MQSVTGQQGVAYRHIISLALPWSFRTSITTQIAKNCRRQQSHSHLRSPPREIPASIRIYLVFPETRITGLHFCHCMYRSIFIQSCAVGSKRRIFAAPESTRVRFGRSRLSKVADFGTNRKRVCDFLLVGHCVLHRFWDTAIYWLKIAYFSYPTLIRRSRSLCSLWNLRWS